MPTSNDHGLVIIAFEVGEPTLILSTTPFLDVQRQLPF